jgi:hypothetical protein
MSATVKCDKCGKQVDNDINNGFSKLTFWTKDKEGNNKMVTIDLCEEDTKEMTLIVLNWAKVKY